MRSHQKNRTFEQSTRYTLTFTGHVTLSKCGLHTDHAEHRTQNVMIEAPARNGRPGGPVM